MILSRTIVTLILSFKTIPYIAPYSTATAVERTMRK